MADVPEKKGRAMEINEVPACANCLVEIEGENLDEAGVLQNGLERFGRVDGGLRQTRREARRAEPPKE